MVTHFSVKITITFHNISHNFHINSKCEFGINIFLFCVLKPFHFSGKAASEETKRFLLESKFNGEEQMNQFIEECSNDASRFTKPIRRNVIKNFTNEIVKKKDHPKKIVSMK